MATDEEKAGNRDSKREKVQRHHDDAVAAGHEHGTPGQQQNLARLRERLNAPTFFSRPDRTAERRGERRRAREGQA